MSNGHRKIIEKKAFFGKVPKLPKRKRERIVSAPGVEGAGGRKSSTWGKLDGPQTSPVICNSQDNGTILMKL